MIDENKHKVKRKPRYMIFLIYLTLIFIFLIFILSVIAFASLETND